MTTPQKCPDAEKKSTQAKLLEAAAKVFAEKGYHSTSLRDITTEAGANLASVNYHFGDKAAIYRLVLVKALAALPPVPAVNQGPAEAVARPMRVLVLVQEVDRAFTQHVNGLACQLMRHEERQPSGVLGSVLTELLRPRHKALVAQLADLTECSPEDSRVHHIAKTLVNAMKSYHLEKESLALIAPEVFTNLEPGTYITILTEQILDLVNGLRTRKEGGL